MDTGIVAFCLIFVVLAGAGMLLFNRGSMHKQLSTAINPTAKKTSMLASIQQSGFSVSERVQAV